MLLEELLIAHRIIAWLLPDELEELQNLLERVPLPVPRGCIVPLRELHREVMVEFGEDCEAAVRLGSLIL